MHQAEQITAAIVEAAENEGNGFRDRADSVYVFDGITERDVLRVVRRVLSPAGGPRPCPFCGSETAGYVQAVNPVWRAAAHYYECGRCNAAGPHVMIPTGAKVDGQMLALRGWNAVAVVVYPLCGRCTGQTGAGLDPKEAAQIYECECRGGVSREGRTPRPEPGGRGARGRACRGAV